VTDNIPDSQKPAVHHYRLEAIERMLEKQNAALAENTACQRETTVALKFVSETLERYGKTFEVHSQKLETAGVCEVRIETLEQRVAALENAQTKEAKSEAADANFIRHARRLWPVILALLALLHPALYAQITGTVQPPVLPTIAPPLAPPQPVPTSSP
jgi:hypothetical protein